MMDECLERVPLDCCCLYWSFIMMTLDVMESFRLRSVGSRRSLADASIIRKDLCAKGPENIPSLCQVQVKQLR